MLGMTEWNVATSRITGRDTAENNDLKDTKQEIVSVMESNNINGTHTNRADGLRERSSSQHIMDEPGGGLHDLHGLSDQSSSTLKQLQRRHPPTRQQLQRTDSNLTLDSDLSSEPQNSPTEWNLNSSVGKDQEYIMNQKLIEVEACNRATRRSGVMNYTSGLADIKESSFDFEVEKIRGSPPPPSPKSPMMRSSSVGMFKQVSTKVHSELKRSMSTLERGTYAARRKALTRSIQEWVNSIDRTPHPEQDDNEALSFLPVSHSPKEATTTGVPPSLGSNDLDAKQATVLPKEQSSTSQQKQESPSGHSKTGHQSYKTGQGERLSPGEKVKALASKPIRQHPVNYSRKPVDQQLSNSELIMIASHYRQEHGQSPITRRQRLLHMGISHSSEVSTCSARSHNSLEEILKYRDDPEEILLDLGFGSREQDLMERVPTRFYSKPSKARGMNIGQFLTNCHEQEIRSYDDFNIGGGFRSIVGILQRSREGQARQATISKRMRKMSVVNAWNKWLNKTNKVNTEDNEERQRKDGVSDNVVRVACGYKNLDVEETEIHGAKFETQYDISSDSKTQSGSCEVVEEIITTSSSVEALDQELELIVKEESIAAVNRHAEIKPVSQQVEEELPDSVHMQEQSKVKSGQHWILPLSSVTEDSEGSVASKKSSCSTLEGESSGSTLISRRGDRFSFDKPEENNLQEISKDCHPLVLDHRVDNPAEIYSIKDTKEHLRQLPGHCFSNTPQESFEFEEVSTASEMMEDERRGLERLSAMRGQFSRDGSGQSDSSGFADDLVEVLAMSLPPLLDDNDHDVISTSLPPLLDDNDHDVICVHDKDVQTNLGEFLSKEERRTDLIVDSERYDSFEEDSPFNDTCPKITPQKRTRSDTFPRPSERVPWSADHPRSVMDILKTLKDNSSIETSTLKENSSRGRSKRPPLLKLKSVFADYPEELATTKNLSTTQLPSINSTAHPSNSSQLPSIHSAVQPSNFQLPSIDSNVQICNSSHLPSIDSIQQSNSSHLPSIDTSVPKSNSSQLPSIDSSLQKSNILSSNAQLDCGDFQSPPLDSSTTLSPSLCELDSTGTVTPVIATEDDNTNEHCAKQSNLTSSTNIRDDLQGTKTNVVSTFEVYLRKDYRGLSTVTPSKEIPNEELTSSESEHNTVCCDLNDLIGGGVKSCDIQPPMNEMEISNAKQQMALQDILFLHRAISSYKFELVELEGLSDKIYQVVHSHLTLSERFELGSLKTLRLQVMDEVESIESLLVRLAHTISNDHQVEDFSGTYRNALDHLQVLKQMITLLQEQKMLRDMLGSLEVEYRIAFGSVVEEHPMPWTAERAQLIQQLMDLKAELDRQRQSSQKQFASSLQEMKHDLLEQLRNDVIEETENLRSQLKLKETEVENLRRQLQTTCDGISNQSKISSHVT